ncbi:AAA family ATPase [Arenibacter sp. GZD96]|uniref:ATP-binding protein n=1 Tax=Aurantibrevibacter litoralis TaxID=3106030 RepID=UPI002AFFBF73|nr:AAA family ATPase [Arenibacter sp. GZD-96]MEA1785514.1 AAA family ATPase [Arenibacter sp. GZD-96]
MERLLEKSATLVQRVRAEKKRYLYHEINWKNRLIGIKGARGTGKTTLLLQKLQQLQLAPTEGTYWSLDDFYFTTHSLVETAEEFYKRGGKYLFLDEVHKYENWSLHIKNLYDFYPELKIVFTGSSIIDISREEGDLSRRVLMYSLFGLSYREYLAFNDVYNFEPISLKDILSGDRKWSHMFPQDFRPLAHFEAYLEHGYYPFSMEDKEGYATRLQQLLRLIVEYDMAELKGFDIRNAKKMLQLLHVVASNVPFQPNLSAVAVKSGIHRNSVLLYLHFLEQAQLIKLLYPSGISLAGLQKPEKIYLDNTNLVFALAGSKPNAGNLRETFFISQVLVRHRVAYPKQGDFLVEDTHTFEVGGKDKSNKQIKDVHNAFVVADNVEFPVGKLPLWLFGFLY